MINCGDYPAGAARDSRAPYNEHLPREIEVDVMCSQSLSKTVSVKTNSYGAAYDDKEGYIEDFSDTDFKTEFHENDHYTPLQLISLFKRDLEKLLNDAPVTYSIPQLKWLIKECEGWCDNETTIIKD